jgi:hypothetical protein
MLLKPSTAVGDPRASLLVTAPKRETAPAKAYDEFGIISPRDGVRIIVQPTTRA